MWPLKQNQTTAALRRVPFTLELAGERQRVDLGDFAATDSFTATYSGQTTGAINHSSDISAAFKSALEALSNIEADDITVIQISATVYDVIFGGSLAGTDAALLTLTPTGFTPTGVSTTDTAGDPATGLTITPADDLQISKNGAAQAAGAGTVTEIGDGQYSYEATATEVDTEGFWLMVVLRTDVRVAHVGAYISPASDETGSPVIRSGTAQAGATGSITLDTGASSTNDYYKHTMIYIRSGTGAGQARYCYGYNGTTKIASIEPAWTTAPDSTSVWDILPVVPQLWDLMRTNHNATGTFGDVASASQFAETVKAAMLAGSAAPIVTDADGNISIAKRQATP